MKVDRCTGRRGLWIQPDELMVHERCPNGDSVFLRAGELTDLVGKNIRDRFKAGR